MPRVIRNPILDNTINPSSTLTNTQNNSTRNTNSRRNNHFAIEEVISNLSRQSRTSRREVNLSLQVIEFRNHVYQAVYQIPYGRVATYGSISRYVGYPRHARHVGNALKMLSITENTIVTITTNTPDDSLPSTQQNRQESEEEQSIPPWHRVISSKGTIPARVPTSQVHLQAELLRAEGIHVDFNGLDYKIDLKTYNYSFI